jgi:NAD(P)-dependent dehydrogenase (short-subunit alcohol dehydrogenase family)
MGGRLEGKITIVTGGASGLGRAVSQLFAKNDATVAVLDRNHTQAQEVVKGIIDHGGKATAYQCDVTKENDVINAFDSVIEKYGKLDVLHTNVGILGRQKPITETSFEEWQKIISTNLTGMYFCARCAIIQMKTQGAGTIVFTGSNWAYVCEPGYSPYSASKGGVVSFARALALDHAKDNIRINVVCPGNMATAMLDEVLSLEENPDEFLKAMGRVSRPEEIAPLVLFLASDESLAMKGSAVIIDQGESLQYGPGLGS